MRLKIKLIGLCSDDDRGSLLSISLIHTKLQNLEDGTEARSSSNVEFQSNAKPESNGSEPMTCMAAVVRKDGLMGYSLAWNCAFAFDLGFLRQNGGKYSMNMAFSTDHICLVCLACNWRLSINMGYAVIPRVVIKHLRRMTPYCQYVKAIKRSAIKHRVVRPSHNLGRKLKYKINNSKKL